MEFKIKDIVKGNKADFSFFRSGNMFYAVTVHGTKWTFPVSLKDIAGASLFPLCVRSSRPTFSEPPSQS